MNFKTTLAALIVLAALVILVVFRDQVLPPPTAQTTPVPTPLAAVLDPNVNNATQITVQTADGRSVSLSRELTGTWKIDAPQPGPADDARVKQDLQSLATLAPSRVITGTQDLSAFGFNPPTATITLRTSVTNTVVMKVGGKNPTSQSYYAQVQGKPDVYLLPSFGLETLIGYVNTPPVQPTPLPSPTVTAGPANGPPAPATGAGATAGAPVTSPTLDLPPMPPGVDLPPIPTFTLPTPGATKAP